MLQCFNLKKNGDKDFIDAVEEQCNDVHKSGLSESGGARAPHILADQLTLYNTQPHHITYILPDPPPNFQTFLRPCKSNVKFYNSLFSTAWILICKSLGPFFYQVCVSKGSTYLIGCL